MHLKTPSGGKRKMFAVGVTNALQDIEISQHHIIDENETVAFIESSQLCNFPRWCRRNVIAFRDEKSVNLYLGIIQSVHLLDSSPSNNIFEWAGPVITHRISGFAQERFLSKWEDSATHFMFWMFSPSDIEMLFLNQIRGIPIGNETICSTCRSEIGGGVHC